MGQKMAFFPFFVASNNHKAGSLDSHLENFTPLKEKSIQFCVLNQQHEGQTK